MRTIYINTESVISALFLLGYDFLDPLTISSVLAELVKAIHEEKRILDGNDEYECEFSTDIALSDAMEACLDLSFGARLKDGCDMDSNVASYCKLDGEYLSLGQYINKKNNRLLASFIERYVDLRSVLMRKITTYGYQNINLFKSLFCDKERDILFDVFGFKDMLLKRELKSTYTRGGSSKDKLTAEDIKLLQKSLE